MTRHYLAPEDMDRLRLFVWELQRLSEFMKQSQHPDSERLENLLRRFQASPETDRLQPHG